MTIVLVNSLIIQQILDPQPGRAGMTERDRKALSARTRGHLNPYSIFHIDMNTHLGLGPTSGSEAHAA